MKTVFLLDMDDTLLDFQRAERENLLSVLASCGVNAGEETARRFHEINDSLWKALERGEIGRSRIVTKRFELLFEELGLSLDAARVAESYFYGLAELCYPFEGAKEFLQTLSERGRIFIATNGSAYIQRRHLTDSGILPYTSGVFISDEVGFNKPSFEYTRHVAAHIADFEPERAVYVGDSLTSDRLCAERMGIDFILFSPRGNPGYAGNKAGTYAEVLRILDRL